MLLPHQLHIWCVEHTKIDDSKLLEQYHACLDHEEKKKQARFRFAEHRHQYLISRALVRTVLSLYAGDVSPEKWRFNSNKYGRPFIANPGYQHIKFNLSHTKGLMTLSVVLHHDTGIDVEWVRYENNVLGLANRYFSPKEYQVLRALPERVQKKHFFDLWTLKEAYIKACGMGLSIPLNHFNFTFDDENKIDITFHSDRKDYPHLWQFWQLRYSNTHQIAVALKTNSVCKPYDLTIRSSIPLLQFEALDCEIFRRSF